jgi:hypothetical protein
MLQEADTMAETMGIPALRREFPPIAALLQPRTVLG